MNPLSKDCLSAARAAVVANAKFLLSDAHILLNEQSSGRGYALSVLAREEMGKLAMLIRASYAVKGNEAFDWPRLRRRMLSHSEKLRASALVQIVHSTNLLGVSDVKTELRRRLQEPTYQQLLNVGKQGGLYVEVSDRGIMSPSDVSAREAWEVYHRARTLFVFFDSGEETDPESHFMGIQDFYGKVICLTEDLIEAPDSVTLPR